ncbi:hypothetical protein K450DRAFT_282476 [Umbelopsis ramanniana AG]|uniref:Transketolase-like pyrimidine-binding domain-containing protein n=1 Tax=Umbelopsis ramanniana AG TaxID=1314678 RepID=A0AAD5E531_UMBRA|nr:uncharacterized protein K450DRAFT_282476 [Umbelopsis ramanniana AG]KAI8577536.1 hypothetical protein K450DRAFT_282476 [Umbelopsis ramanniana AG]
MSTLIKLISARRALTSRLPVVLSRSYHDDGVYGYRVRKEYQLPDYDAEELANRMDNGGLLRFVQAYRTHGHRGANLDPLDIMQREEILALNPERYGLTDPHKSYNLAGILHVNQSKHDKSSKEEATFDTILHHLQSTYCGRIAYEFMHIPSASERRWWYYAVESWNKPTLSTDQKKRIYDLVNKSETFDHFMAKKFPNVKRYGLEGAESMMVALDRLFEISAKAGLKNIVVGMPHRGRLNLLTDLLQYPPQALFHKLKGNSELPANTVGSGDVLSHLANSPTLDYQGKQVQVSLLHNPSHLEAVNPVVMGKSRAKQMNLMDMEDKSCALGDRVLGVQLHGDAAFTGQGVVMETLGLSNLPHYSSGGCIHIVVNNQIGYTTPAQNSRSTVYCSDIAKMINAPVIHVNGDFPEDVSRAMDLVFEYRDKFRKDIILDLITYRRWGHNELDEPAFTQPLMYHNIRARQSVGKMYEQKLISEGVLSAHEDADKVSKDYYEALEEGLSEAEGYTPSEKQHLQGNWKNMLHPTDYNTLPRVDTGVDEHSLLDIGKQSVSFSDQISVHPRVDKYHIQARLKKLKSGKGIDWATAESLAFGTLLAEGYNVRISGQDVGRGTFSQRHAMLVDQDTEKVIVPLNNLKTTLGDASKAGHLEVANSSLSEMAVLGFEYGVSIESPNILPIWEAQFGDFFNSAQVMIDTYVSSGEAKWLRQSGLTMLLPHGYDGAGPEHSTSRIERFLQISDDPFDDDMDVVNPNWHVVNCTTPAQYFHVLRRQMKRSFRKPLIVAAPKGLLKSPVCTSSLSDMASGTHFQPILGDATVNDASSIEKVVFVSGKLYYDLVKERENRGLNNKVALVRIEELCPFPRNEIANELSKYNNAGDYVWCQEEPQNGGAYSFMLPRLSKLLPSGQTLKYVGRKPLAAPAVGIAYRHREEQATILENVF